MTVSFILYETGQENQLWTKASCIITSSSTTTATATMECDSMWNTLVVSSIAPAIISNVLHLGLMAMAWWYAQMRSVKSLQRDPVKIKVVKGKKGRKNVQATAVSEKPYDPPLSRGGGNDLPTFSSDEEQMMMDKVKAPLQKNINPALDLSNQLIHKIRKPKTTNKSKTVKPPNPSGSNTFDLDDPSSFNARISKPVPNNQADLLSSASDSDFDNQPPKYNASRSQNPDSQAHDGEWKQEQKLNINRQDSLSKRKSSQRSRQRGTARENGQVQRYRSLSKGSVKEEGRRVDRYEKSGGKSQQQ